MRLDGEDAGVTTKVSIVQTLMALVPIQALALAHCHFNETLNSNSLNPKTLEQHARPSEENEFDSSDNHSC